MTIYKVTCENCKDTNPVKFFSGLGKCPNCETDLEESFYLGKSDTSALPTKLPSCPTCGFPGVHFDPTACLSTILGAYQRSLKVAALAKTMLSEFHNGEIYRVRFA